MWCLIPNPHDKTLLFLWKTHALRAFSKEITGFICSGLRMQELQTGQRALFIPIIGDSS
jgi:hypothetical protein